MARQLFHSSGFKEVTWEQLDYFYLMNLNRQWPFNFIFLYAAEIQYHCMFKKKKKYYGN